mmetsp:Transcript_60912/g.161758  ORF Transcript_60912/g.161758 Transcript_60912/m.161758 type:complete len:306 (+) Transcript_60912:1318-2235(+)
MPTSVAIGGSRAARGINSGATWVRIASGATCVCNASAATLVGRASASPSVLSFRILERVGATGDISSGSSPHNSPVDSCGLGASLDPVISIVASRSACFDETAEPPEVSAAGDCGDVVDGVANASLRHWLSVTLEVMSRSMEALVLVFEDVEVVDVMATGDLGDVGEVLFKASFEIVAPTTNVASRSISCMCLTLETAGVRDMMPLEPFGGLLAFTCTQGCIMLSFRGMRSTGSNLSSLRTRSSASSGNPEGKTRSTLMIRCNPCIWLAAANGGVAARLSYKSTPRVQMSKRWSCGWLSTISGAR